MNTCSRAARVFRIASAGEELPNPLAAHAAGCDACQAALERARSFDAELDAAAASLVSPAMPNLGDGAGDVSPPTRLGLLPIIATVAAALLVIAVLLSGYNLLTAPIGSQETPTPTRTPTPTQSPIPTLTPSPTQTPAPSGTSSPSPASEPPATATSEPTPVSGGVPVEVAERTVLPPCGHEVVERTPNVVDYYDAEVRDCFLAAYVAETPAEFSSDTLTPEGGRIHTIYRLLPSGEVEIFVDWTQDPLATPEWTRTICLSVREIDQDPNGVPIFIGDECDEPIVIGRDATQ